MAHTAMCGVLAGGMVALGFYACVLWERSLRLRRNQMYAETLVRVLETAVKMRRRDRK